METDFAKQDYSFYTRHRKTDFILVFYVIRDIFTPSAALLCISSVTEIKISYLTYVVSQRCHRIASFLRLASDVNLSRITINTNETPR